MRDKLELKIQNRLFSICSIDDFLLQQEEMIFECENLGSCDKVFAQSYLQELGNPKFDYDDLLERANGLEEVGILVGHNNYDLHIHAQENKALKFKYNVH